MTEAADSSDLERRRHLTRLSHIWPNGWTRGALEEYAHAVRLHTPTEVQAAVDTAIDTRTTRPAPAQLRELADQARDQARTDHQRRERRADTTRDGKGCPACRRDHGDQAVDAGSHQPWIGDGTMILCQTHQLAWRGTGHQPDHDDAGELTPEQWRSRASTGAFGSVIQALAAWGGGPASIAVGVTTDLTREIHDTMQERQPA